MAVCLFGLRTESSSVFDRTRQINKRLLVIPAKGMTSKGDDEQSRCDYDNPIAASKRLNQLS